MFSICGCSHPPTAQQIVGTWESTDKTYTLDLGKNCTFTFINAAASPTSLQDMTDKLGFAMIAPSGKWSLSGSDLDVSTIAKGIPMVWKIGSWSDSTLVLRFGDANAISFVRKKANE
jgi:hypothetical protein